MPSTKTRPLTWAISYNGVVKGSVLFICINPQGKGTLTGENLRVAIEEAIKLSPTKCEVYIENNDDTYCQKWLEDNKTALNLVGGAKDLNNLRKKDPHWKFIREKYLEFRKGKSHLNDMMDRDIANVLKNHPEWKDSAEEHIIDTAIDVAWLQINNEKEADITFLWYQHELSETVNHAMQFIMNNAETYQLKPIKLKHFPFDLKDLHETQKKLAAKQLAPVEVKPTVVPAGKQEEEKTSTMKKAKTGLHPDMVGVLSYTFLGVRAREGNQAMLALMLDLNSKLLEESSEESEESTSTEEADKSTSYININKKLRAVETSTPSPPGSPKNTANTADSPSSSPKTTAAVVSLGDFSFLGLPKSHCSVVEQRSQSPLPQAQVCTRI